MGRGWVHGVRVTEGAKKGKLFTKLAKEITVAVKSGGGSDPDANPRLRMALSDARKSSMPKNTIERAIIRGTGEGSEAELEEICYEGYGPHGVAFLVETLTDNRKRTVQDLRAIFARGDGSLGAEGSVLWMFDRVSLLQASIAEEGIDPEEAAIEAGASDVEAVEGEKKSWLFYASVEDLFQVEAELKKRGWEVDKAELSYRAKTPMSISEEQEADLEKLFSKLDDNDDVKKVHCAL